MHILDEGIDIPECDSVYLTHPNNNPINIIQRISRSNRIDINNKDKISRIFIWSKNQLKLNNIIDRLSKYIKINYGKETNDIINNNDIIKKENKIRKFSYIQNKIFHEKECNINTNLATKEEFEKIKNELVDCKKSESINNDKTINLEDVSKWLNIRKDHLKKVLIDKFKYDDDYIQFNEIYDGKHVFTNNKKKVLLTSECAKLLCIISRGKKNKNI